MTKMPTKPSKTMPASNSKARPASKNTVDANMLQAFRETVEEVIQKEKNGLREETKRAIPLINLFWMNVMTNCVITQRAE